MAKDLNPPNLFNPLMLWTDLGMRALEMTLSSSQNIGEGLDRLTRAGGEASEEAATAVATRGQSGALAATPGLALAAQMQRTTFDLMTQAWQQWMNTLGALASFGAGRSIRETARENPLLNAMQEGFQFASTAGEAASTQARSSSSRQQGGRQRERQADEMEHAFSAAEPKRRSRGNRAKPKARSRNH